jgi:hypothetical protein
MLLNNSTAPYEQIECHQMTSQTTSNGVIFINLNSNVINLSFPHCMSRTIAVDECDNLSKAPKSSQMLQFWTPVLSGCYDVWGHAFESVLCSTGKETFFLTDRSQPNRQRRAKFQALAFDSDITSPSTAMPMHQQRRHAESLFPNW